MSDYIRKLRFFYQIQMDIFYIEGDSDEFKQQTLQQKVEDCYNINYYEAQKEYEASHQGLLDYRTDFYVWVKQIPKLDYTKYYNHEGAVMNVFKSKSTRIMKTLNLEPITYKEFIFYERTHKSAMMTFNNNFKNIEIDSFGYDFSGFYPFLLACHNFKIPIKEGKRKKFKKLKFDNLSYGIYNVKITCDSHEFKRLFMFSKEHTYTHYSLDFAYQHKDKFNIKFELVLESEYNALVYSDDKLIDSNTIFGDWYDYLNYYKRKYPKNKLVKRLMSSLWGSITSFNKVFFSDDEIDDIDMSDLNDDDKTEYKIIDTERFKDDTREYGIRTRFQCIPSSKPYKYELARLKPFLVSYARTCLGQLIIDENLVDNLVRTHTDNITLNKPHDFKNLHYKPLPEDKTSGRMTWFNCIFNSRNRPNASSS